MKKIEIVVAGFVFLPMTALSQHVPTNDESAPLKANSRFNPYSIVMPIDKMDQRKIYNWGNGQRSTPTGRQAGEYNVDYAKVFGDSAIVVSNPYANDLMQQKRNPGISRAFQYAPVVPISMMDQRKIYNWGVGQRSTPTGRQAYERNVNYAKVVGDSAIVVQGPHEKTDP